MQQHQQIKVLLQAALMEVQAAAKAAFVEAVVVLPR